MKKRVQIDSALVVILVILTLFLYGFPGLFPKSRLLDNIFDLLGFWLVLKGCLIRVTARGHKKRSSAKGAGLVETGLYSLVRHPMYLGSFLMGCGFVLIVWPFWTLPLFFWLFALRFRRQMNSEERTLKRKFKADYDAYARRVPRFFPAYPSLQNMNFRKVFPAQDLKNTPERLLLVLWTGVAVVLESLQQWILFRSVQGPQTVALFAGAAVIFAMGLWYSYYEKQRAA